MSKKEQIKELKDIIGKEIKKIYKNYIILDTVTIKFSHNIHKRYYSPIKNNLEIVKFKEIASPIVTNIIYDKHQLTIILKDLNKDIYKLILKSKTKIITYEFIS